MRTSLGIWALGPMAWTRCAARSTGTEPWLWEEGDEELFHEVLGAYQRLGDGHPRLESWIRRVDARPRA